MKQPKILKGGENTDCLGTSGPEEQHRLHSLGFPFLSSIPDWILKKLATKKCQRAETTPTPQKAQEKSVLSGQRMRKEVA